MRFFLDHNVTTLVRKVLLGRGHECWTATEASRILIQDEDLAVYAADRHAVLVSHDNEFAQWRKRRTWGQHVWLRCPELDAADVFGLHLDESVACLAGMPDVVIEVRPESVRVHPARWS